MKKAVVWPANIDADKSKARGRKIPAAKAVASPTLQEIEASARRLGLSPEAEKAKAYPREGWEKKGLVRVEKTKPKKLMLSEIAAGIKESRG